MVKYQMSGQININVHSKPIQNPFNIHSFVKNHSKSTQTTFEWFLSCIRYKFEWFLICYKLPYAKTQHF